MLFHTDSILQSVLVPHSFIAVTDFFLVLLMEVSLVLYLPLLAFFAFPAEELFLQSGHGFLISSTP